MTACIGAPRVHRAALGGAAAWPVVARAQQPERVRQIGVFMRLSESDPVTKGYLTALSGDLRRSAGVKLQSAIRKAADGRRRCRHKHRCSGLGAPQP